VSLVILVLCALVNLWFLSRSVITDVDGISVVKPPDSQTSKSADSFCAFLVIHWRSNSDCVMGVSKRLAKPRWHWFAAFGLDPGC